MVEAMPEHVGGKVMFSWPWQKESCGFQASGEAQVMREEQQNAAEMHLKID